MKTEQNKEVIKYFAVYIFFVTFICFLKAENTVPAYIYDFDICKGYSKAYMFNGKIYKDDNIYIVYKNGRTIFFYGEQFTETIIYRQNEEKKMKISYTKDGKQKVEIWLPTDYQIKEYDVNYYENLTEKY